MPPLGPRAQQKPARRPRPSPPPVSDVQSSGGNYGLPKANAFKHTPQFQRALTDVFEAQPPAVQQHLVKTAAAHPDHPTSQVILRHVARRSQQAHVPDANVGADIKRANAFQKTNAFQHDYLAAAEAGFKQGYGNKTASSGDDMGVQAPAMWTLQHIAAAPVHGTITTADALARGKGLGAAVSEGARAFVHPGKAKLGSQLLSDLGVHNKAIRAVGGFATDVLADPTTYLSLGASVPAKLAAEQAAEVAARDAAVASEHLGPRAAAQAESEAYQRTHDEVFAAHPGKARGLQINARAHVPLTNVSPRASTSGLGSTVLADQRAALGAKLREGTGGPVSKTTSKALRAVSHVNPSIRPPNFTQAQWDTLRQSARVYRGNVNARERATMETMHGLNAAVGAKEGPSFFAGLETIGPLTREQQATRHLLDDVGGELQARGAIRGQIGHGTPPQIPEVQTTVDDAQKVVAKAQRARVTAERQHARLREQLGVSKGRAQILSRSVGGTQGERLAEQPLAPRYQAGGYGVQQAHTALRASEQNVRDARQAVEQAGQLLEHAKAGARGQRAAQRELGKFNRSAKGFMPHMTEAEISPPDTLPAVPRQTGGGMSFRSGLSRRYLEPIHLQTNAAAEHFSTHPAAVVGSYLGKAGRRLEAADYWSRVAGLGKPLEHGRDLALAPGEMVYRVDAQGLHPIESKLLPGTVNEAKVRRALAREGEPVDAADKFVVLPAHVKAQAETMIRRGSTSSHAFTRGYDRTLAQLKAFQTIRNPSYQLTNLSGDVFMARQGGATTRDFMDAAKVSGAMHRESTARAGGAAFRGEHAPSPTTTIDIRGRQVPVSEIAKRFRAQGLQEGHVLDIQDLLGGQLKNTRLRRFNTARELFPRYASFIGGLRRGMSDAQAARHVVEHHFDYSDLTGAERGLRRIVPFYTFAARNTRLQGKKLLTDPRVQSHFEMAREESAGAAGKPADWERTLQNYQQRGLPFALPGGLLLYSRSPVTDLNQYARPWDWRTLLQNATNRTAPLLKAPFELATNRNFFFNEPINPNEPRTGRVEPGAKGLVPAPNVLGIGKLLEALHLAHPIQGTHAGQGMVPGWSRYIPYFLGQLPQTNFQQQFLTNNADPNHGINALLAAANFATGVKTAKQDPAKDAYGHALDRANTLQAQINSAAQRGDTTQARALQRELSALQKVIPELKKAAGYKVKSRGRSRKGPAVSLGGGGVGGAPPGVRLGGAGAGAGSVGVTLGG